MTSDPLPLHLPQFCIYCGASLIYTKIDEAAGHASWKCTGCAKLDTNYWVSFVFKEVEQDESATGNEIIDPVDQDNQSATDIELSPSVDFPLPPPPPRPSHENSEDRGVFHEQYEEEYLRVFGEQYKKEFLEHRRQHEALRRQIEAEGIVAIVKAAHFPLFALIDLQERFPYPSYNWGLVGTAEKTQRSIESFGLRYEGPYHPRNSERITISQVTNERNPDSNLRLRRSYILSRAGYIVHCLAGLTTDSEETSMQALRKGMAIYQYVNHESISRTPFISTSIQAQTGEALSWSIRRFNAPLPLVYAVAQIENTAIAVGAIGTAAAEIEHLLGKLTRLTPESTVLNQIDRGARAWEDYLQQYNRDRFGQK